MIPPTAPLRSKPFLLTQLCVSFLITHKVQCVLPQRSWICDFHCSVVNLPQATLLVWREVGLSLYLSALQVWIWSGLSLHEACVWFHNYRVAALWPVDTFSCIHSSPLGELEVEKEICVAFYLCFFSHFLLLFLPISSSPQILQMFGLPEWVLQVLGFSLLFLNSFFSICLQKDRFP